MKQREAFGLWVALAILAAVAVLAYRSIDATARTLAWVERTHKVREKLEDVSGAYSRATSARRAYLVAGDDSQLPDVPVLDAHLETTVSELRELLIGDAPQLARLENLAELLDERIHVLQVQIVDRRAGGTGAETAEGLALVARIRTAREAMEKSGNEALADRDAATRRDVVRTKLAEILGTCISFSILLFAFGRLNQETRRRRESETALRASEKFLDSIIENIPDMIFVKEAKELRFERINRAGEDLLGVDRSVLIHKNDFDFFPPEQARAFQALDHRTLAGGVALDIDEEPIRTKNGERWLHTKKVPIVDESGAPKYLLGISEDITERRREAVVLKAAKDAAEAANQELEAFSYAVAHDLRAPLRSVAGFSMALEEDYADKLDKTGLEFLSRMRESARQMAQRIDGLLGLSRLSRGDLVIERLDISRIAEHSAAALREAYPERDVEVVVQSGLVADGDARLIASVLDNLLGNAWKFTSKRAGARVEVGASTTDGVRAFFVRDNGAGFEQAYAQRLFGAFQRLHSAVEFEGTGIGLATVQRIVRRHGGRIWAEGEVERGATFYFTL